MTRGKKKRHTEKSWEGSKEKGKKVIPPPQKKKRKAQTADHTYLFERKFERTNTRNK